MGKLRHDGRNHGEDPDHSKNDNHHPKDHCDPVGLKALKGHQALIAHKQQGRQKKQQGRYRAGDENLDRVFEQDPEAVGDQTADAERTSRLGFRCVRLQGMPDLQKIFGGMTVATLQFFQVHNLRYHYLRLP